MHLNIENKLVESFAAGIPDDSDQSVSFLCLRFREGLEDEAGAGVDCVEDIRGLMTLAYEFGRDCQHVGHEKAKESGRKMARAVGEQSIPLQEWRRRWTRRKFIADRIAKVMNDRARRQCGESGLDPNLLGIHPHNATVSRDAGKPWEGIDYEMVDKCRDTLRHQFDYNRIIGAWDKEVRVMFDGIDIIEADKR